MSFLLWKRDLFGFVAVTDWVFPNASVVEVCVFHLVFVALFMFSSDSAELLMLAKFVSLIAIKG